MARLHTSFHPVFSTEVEINPAEVLANVGDDQTFTVTGLKLNYPVHVEMPTVPDTGLVFSNWHASAKDTLKVRITNVTALPINQAAFSVKVVQF